MAVFGTFDKAIFANLSTTFQLFLVVYFVFWWFSLKIVFDNVMSNFLTALYVNGLAINIYKNMETNKNSIVSVLLMGFSIAFFGVFFYFYLLNSKRNTSDLQLESTNNDAQNIGNDWRNVFNDLRVAFDKTK
jgi:hypothetical protein